MPIPLGPIGEAHNPETHLIPVILQVPNGQREKLSIFGGDYPTKDGTCVRDYIHVTDLAQAHILALDYLLKGGENNVFNLGNGVGFTNKEVVDVARKVADHPIPAEIAPGGPATPLGWWPPRRKTRLFWAGSPNMRTWRLSCPPPGTGTRATPMATRRAEP